LLNPAEQDAIMDSRGAQQRAGVPGEYGISRETYQISSQSRSTASITMTKKLPQTMIVEAPPASAAPNARQPLPSPEQRG
jgi:hypothetical protein